eukprot:TRINITY_DN367_c0_g2_i3.p1 TRINITY_DN367_c0_g2~~TRINITY_DN367_c0_g2_i3.p1  ORF type:complete len:273 (-),score=109.91 TRINITY_DN367_c0_g2_i3:468-1286(-)
MAAFLARMGVGALAIGGIAFGMQQSLYNVDGGHRAVIWDRFTGVKKKVIGEGTHFRIPGLQYPQIYDIRLKPRVISTVTGTKDLQVVSISLRVLSKPECEKLPTIYKQLGLDFDDRVLPSLGNEVLKAVVARFDADQLLTRREDVSKAVREEMTTRCGEFNILLDDVSITHLAYGREFTKAVEQKQVAQQEFERAKFIVQKAEQQKKAAIIQAEVESEAANLVSNALASHGSGLIEIRRIEAAREVAEKLAVSPGVTYLPSGNNMLLNLPVH